MTQFTFVPYAKLNARQRENYNFHKIAARLADYGFNCLRLTDDWQGADFIACHVDGDTFLKVQLKGRLVIDRKYLGKGIHIAFFHTDAVYLYDHDRFVTFVEANGLIAGNTRNWVDPGIRSWPRPPAWALGYLEDFRL